jgi:hypothetical protein
VTGDDAPVLEDANLALDTPEGTPCEVDLAGVRSGRLDGLESSVQFVGHPCRVGAGGAGLDQFTDGDG